MTPSERLLGVTMSQNLTWSPHLWGRGNCREKSNTTGIIPDLLRRLGFIKQLERPLSVGKIRRESWLACKSGSNSLSIREEEIVQQWSYVISCGAAKKIQNYKKIIK